MNSSERVPGVFENAPLAPHTTLGIGGPARFMLPAKTEEQILDGLEFARVRGCPVFVLGGGSNVLVSDAGFPGLVIKVEIQGIEEAGDGSGCISAAAGVDWDAFVQHCVSRNLAGVECLSGIPGTVGGAPVQSIAAYGEDVREVIGHISALDRDSLQFVQLGNADCGFAYRTSIFNTTHKDRYVILRVNFALRTDGQSRLLYADLEQRFAGRSLPPTLAQVRETVLEIRRAKSMVLSKDDPDSRSAGSFFKNPVLDQISVSIVESRARAGGLLRDSENIPCFAAGPGEKKLSAAWLIERAGFHKGYQLGNAGISSRHALAIINRGGATAQEVLQLMRMIQGGVQQAFGVELQPEPVLVGFEESKNRKTTDTDTEPLD